MDHIKTPWNQPLDLPLDWRDFRNQFESLMMSQIQQLRGPDDAKPSELTDFQLCVRAGVPLKMDTQPDGTIKFTTEKKCKVVRDENGNFLHVYVLEQEAGVASNQADHPISTPECRSGKSPEPKEPS